VNAVLLLFVSFAGLRAFGQIACNKSVDSVDRGKVIRVQMHLSPVTFFSLPLPANRFRGFAA
jgi:hypothetical protein